MNDSRKPVLFVIALSIMAGAGCKSESTGPEPDPIVVSGDFDRQLRSGGIDRTYTLHVPASYEPGDPLPLVIAIHGVPSNGREMQAITAFDLFADRRSFVVAYPNAAIDDWNTGCIQCFSAAVDRNIDDVRFVRDMIRQIRADLDIDDRRIYVAGFSNGALFTHRLACETTDIVTAFASVGATMIAEHSVPPCNPSRAAPIVFIHGTSDRAFPEIGRRFGRDELDLRALSIDETVLTWANRNHCQGAMITSDLPDLFDDGTTVQRKEHSNCEAGAQVVYYRITNGGHTWPGSPVAFAKQLGVKSLDLDASQVIADFFLNHRRN